MFCIPHNVLAFQSENVDIIQVLINSHVNIFNYYKYILIGLVTKDDRVEQKSSTPRFLLRVKLSTGQGPDQKEFEREENTKFIQFKRKASLSRSCRLLFFFAPRTPPLDL